MDSPFIGMICTFGFNYPPRSWSLCSGQVIAISSNQALFALLGAQYGGDGRTSFGLPSLNGRVPVGQGQAIGGAVTWGMGSVHGSDLHTMGLQEMPTHTHSATFVPDGTAQVSFTASTEDAESDTPRDGDYLAKTVAGGTGPDKPEKIYGSNASTTATLAGAAITGFGGNVAVGNSGQGSPFALLQPSLGVNYSIATDGLFPPRS